MTDRGLAAIGWVDYVIIAVSLAVCIWIGLRKDKKKKDENEEEEALEVTLGGRNMAMLPVAFSIMATLLTGNAITAAVGEVYKFGIASIFYPVAGVLTKLFIGYAIVPVLHAYNYVSIYEYVERRFDRPFRLIFSAMYIVSHVVYLALTLYGPSLALTTVTGVPYWIWVWTLGLVCAFYSALGGLKAIIWTDVFQAGLMFFSVLTIIVKATWNAGGIGAVYQANFQSSENIDVHFAYTESSVYRYSIWAVIFAGAVDAIRTTVVSQAGAQRLLCVDSAKKAFKSLVVGGLLMFVFKLLTVIAAMSIYANFQNCDPLINPEEKDVKVIDQMFMYTVNRFLNTIPGMQGLVLAGLISATLSSCSSLINAFAALTLEDFAKTLFPQWTDQGAKQVIICKLSTLVYAIVAIALSFLTPLLGGMSKALLGLMPSLTGPLCGIMFLGFFYKRTNIKAFKIAFAIGLAFSLWITIGSMLHKKFELTLVSDLTGCPGENHTSKEEPSALNGLVGNNVNSNAIVNSNITWNGNETLTFNQTSVERESKYIFPLYLISFMWFGPIGMATTCVLGILLTCILGGNKCKEDRLLSPIVTTDWQKKFSRSRNHKVLLPQDCEPSNYEMEVQCKTLLCTVK